MRRLALVAALALAIATPAAAQAPSTMTFQGVLTDGGGTLYPDGNYDLTFAIYDVSSGGSALYTEAHASVPLVRGGFSVILGSITPLDLPFDQPYWLGIQVGTDPELSPRVPLTSSPYAMGLSLPLTATGGDATTPALEIRNPLGTSIRASNTMTVTDQAGNEALASLFVTGPPDAVGGVLRLNAPGAPSSAYGTAYLGGVSLSSGGPPEFAGAALLVNDENGSGFASLLPTLNGGGRLLLYREPSFLGLYSSPGGGGTGMILDLYGDDREVSFNTALPGDDAVQFPADAVSSTEELNEPGVTSSTYGVLAVAMTSSITTLRSTTIDCPADGYVLVIASCQFGVNHVNGVLSSGLCGVSSSATTLPQNQDVALRLQAAMPSGTYAFPATVHGLFPVTAGSHTFYFNGQEGSGADFTAEDIQLTALYIPTAYGTVTPTIVAGGGGETDAVSVRGGMTESEIADERAASQRDNQMRIENELARLRAEMQQLKTQIAEERVVPAVPKNQVKR